VTVNFVGFTAGGLTQVAADAMAEAVRVSYPDWRVASMAAGGEARLVEKRIAGEADFFFSRSSRALELEIQVPLQPDIDFEQAARFRLVVPFSSQYVHLIVLDKLNVSSLGDLVERQYPFRLGCGVSAVLLFSKMLEYHGATLEEAQQWGASHEAVSISTAEGADALQTGRVDIAFTQAPIPGPFLTSLAVDASMLPIEDPGFAAMLRTLGGVPATIPAKTYPFVEADVSTVSFPYPLVTRSDMPDDVVYHVVKAIFEHSDLLFAVSTDAREHMSPESVAASVALSQTVGEPYHPGALRFYREMGWVD
jgi:TRAP transporter TAXI family solute receptor